MTFQLPFGYLATVKSAHKLHSITMFFSGIMHAIVPLMASKFDWIGVLVVRVLMGIGQASLMTSTQALISKWTPPMERSRIAMFVFNGSLLGNVIAMPISGKLITSRYGWPSVFYVFGLLISTWAIVFYYLGANSPAEHEKISQEERDYIEKNIGKSLNNFTVIWLLRKKKKIFFSLHTKGLLLIFFLCLRYKCRKSRYPGARYLLRYQCGVW